MKSYLFTYFLLPYCFFCIWFPERFFSLHHGVLFQNSFFFFLCYLLFISLGFLRFTASFLFLCLCTTLIPCVCKNWLLVSLPARLTMLFCIISFISAFNLNDFSFHEYCIQSPCAGRPLLFLRLFIFHFQFCLPRFCLCAFLWIPFCVFSLLQWINNSDSGSF